MTPRTFAGLRRPVRPVDQDIAAVELAIADLMTLPKGQIFFDWLRSETTFKVLPSDASDGALRENLGNRQLMQKIEGMGERGRRPNPDGK